jgi:hypothetical protein
MVMTKNVPPEGPANKLGLLEQGAAPDEPRAGISVHHGAVSRGSRVSAER